MRTPATAAPCRPAAPRAAAARTAAVERRRALGACTRLASAASSAAASLPISTTCRTLSLNAAASGAKSCPLPSPPAINTKGPSEARHRRHGRADVRALRVIDVAHARDVGDPRRAMRKARERTRASRAWRAIGNPAASPSASAAKAFAALCRPGDLHARDIEQRLAAARQQGLCAPAQQREIRRRVLRAIENVTTRGGGAAALGTARIAATQGIVRVQHHGRGARENPRLGARIGGRSRR